MDMCCDSAVLVSVLTLREKDCSSFGLASCLPGISFFSTACPFWSLDKEQDDFLTLGLSFSLPTPTSCRLMACTGLLFGLLWTLKKWNKLVC
jgi:hypothetical protein